MSDDDNERRQLCSKAMTMPEDDKSLGDQPTFSGGRQPQDEGPQSLGDEHTFSGGVQNDPQSLGDEATFGDAAGGGEAP
ncbi:MAG: hypothetical protein ABGZ24_24615, partial [Fuerstiella sp.]